MNDWIEWKGGECPVPHGELFQYKTVSGAVSNVVANDGMFDWSGDLKAGRIVAYRIVEVTQPASKKYDTDKPELSYIDEYFPNALNGVQAVNKFGAEKYGWHTWQGVDNAIMRYKHALRRHQLALASGEKCDPESGLRHEYHIAWNALSIAELETKKIH